MNVAINGMLVVTGEIGTADGQIAKDVLEGTIASVCGIQSLQMGAFGGIIVGLGVAALHNRFHAKSYLNALPFLRFQICSDYLLQLYIYVCWNGQVWAFVYNFAGSEWYQYALEGWKRAEADMREL